MSQIGGHFPNKKQTLLLKSALSERLKAIRYFVAWLELNHLEKLNTASQNFLSDFMDSLDLGSQRMLPLVIHNLGEQTHPYFGFLLGTRKNYWVRNKQIEHKALQIQKFLEQHGIPSMQIKGLDLATRFYENISHRPMNDGDILIPFQFRKKAIELAEAGLFGNKPNTFGLKIKNFVHAIHLDFEGKIHIDLHWNIFREYTYMPGSCDFIWQNATKETKAGVTNFRMSATHALFLSLVHGRGFDVVPPFRWVADAKMIIDKSEIDWDAFLELSKRFQFKPFLKKAFPYLVEQHEFTIPSDFLEKLSQLRTDRLEEKYYRSISGNIRKYGFASMLWHGTARKVFYHRLFLKDSDISLLRFIFSWYLMRIKALFV
jgi:hypothetical protein